MEQRVMRRLENNDAELYQLEIYWDGRIDETRQKQDPFGTVSLDTRGLPIAFDALANTSDRPFKVQARTCRDILAILGKNRSLQRLAIKGCHLSESMGKLLARCLASNTGLKYLDVQDNSIGDVGAKELATALRTNRTLTFLDVSNNAISSKGASLLESALAESNITLQVLNLARGPLSDALAAEDGAKGSGGESVVDGKDSKDVAFLSDLRAIQGHLESNKSLYLCATGQDRFVHLPGRQLEVIPPVVLSLHLMNKLDLSFNRLVDLPPEIRNLRNLEYLVLNNNQIQRIPPELGMLSRLKAVLLKNNKISSIPLSLGLLESLHTLNLQNNKIEQIPRNLAALPHLTGLDLSGNPLRLPKEVTASATWAVLPYWRRQNLNAQTRCRSGQAKLVFLGPRGSGKTSLLRCLQRTYGDRSGQQFSQKSSKKKKSKLRETDFMLNITRGRLAGGVLLPEGPSVTPWTVKIPSGGSSSNASANGMNTNTSPTSPPSLSGANPDDSSSDTSASSAAAAAAAPGSPGASEAVQGDGSRFGDDWLTFHCWDFVDHSASEPSLEAFRFFLSDDAIYVLTFNVFEGQQISELSSFIESILFACSTATIILVGTHADDKRCTKARVEESISFCMTKYMKRYRAVVGVAVVGSQTSKGMDELYKHLLNIGYLNPIASRSIPTQYIILYEMILAMQVIAATSELNPAPQSQNSTKSGNIDLSDQNDVDSNGHHPNHDCAADMRWCSVDKFLRLALCCRVMDAWDALEFFHLAGMLVRFDNKKLCSDTSTDFSNGSESDAPDDGDCVALRDRVVVDGRWLYGILEQMDGDKAHVENGIVSNSDIGLLWSASSQDYSPALHGAFIELMHRHLMIFQLPSLVGNNEIEANKSSKGGAMASPRSRQKSGGKWGRRQDGESVFPTHHLAEYMPVPLLEGLPHAMTRSNSDIGQHEKKQCLIPYLLPIKEPSDLETLWAMPEYPDIVTRLYHFRLMPLAFRETLIIRLIGHGWSVVRLWRDGALLRLSNGSQVLMETPRRASWFRLHIRGADYVRHLIMLVDLISALTREFQEDRSILNSHLCTYNVYVPCIHCRREGRSDLFLFPVTALEEAVARGVRVHYCNNDPDCPVRIDHLAPELTLSALSNFKIKANRLFVEGEHCLVGEGGASRVYKGVLDGKEVVAIKRLVLPGISPAVPMFFSAAHAKRRQLQEKRMNESPSRRVGKFSRRASSAVLPIPASSNTISAASRKKSPLFKVASMSVVMAPASPKNYDLKEDFLETEDERESDGGEHPVNTSLGGGMDDKEEALYGRKKGSRIGAATATSADSDSEGDHDDDDSDDSSADVDEDDDGSGDVTKIDTAGREGDDPDDSLVKEAMESMDQFRREALLLSGIEHENIVTLKGICFEDISMVTEFMELGSLYEFIHNKNNALDWPTTLKIGLDVAKGMLFLHNITPPIIHRDLKSPNILLTRAHRESEDGASFGSSTMILAKVADFGVSGALLAPQLLDKVVDNPTWLAPEIIQKLPYDEKSDVYSYGVVLWEMITRKKYFGELAPFLTDVMDAVVRGDRPSIPPHPFPRYGDLIRRCWHNDPDERPLFDEIVDTLHELVKTMIASALEPGDDEVGLRLERSISPSHPPAARLHTTTMTMPNKSPRHPRISASLSPGSEGYSRRPPSTGDGGRTSGNNKKKKKKKKESATIHTIGAEFTSTPRSSPSPRGPDDAEEEEDSSRASGDDDQARRLPRWSSSDSNSCGDGNNAHDNTLPSPLTQADADETDPIATLDDIVIPPELARIDPAMYQALMDHRAQVNHARNRLVAEREAVARLRNDINAQQEATSRQKTKLSDLGFALNNAVSFARRKGRLPPANVRSMFVSGARDPSALGKAALRGNITVPSEPVAVGGVGGEVDGGGAIAGVDAAIAATAAVGESTVLLNADGADSPIRGRSSSFVSSTARVVVRHNSSLFRKAGVTANHGGNNGAGGDGTIMSERRGGGLRHEALAPTLGLEGPGDVDLGTDSDFVIEYCRTLSERLVTDQENLSSDSSENSSSASTSSSSKYKSDKRKKKKRSRSRSKVGISPPSSPLVVGSGEPKHGSKRSSSKHGKKRSRGKSKDMSAGTISAMTSGTEDDPLTRPFSEDDDVENCFVGGDGVERETQLRVSASSLGYLTNDTIRCTLTHDPTSESDICNHLDDIHHPEQSTEAQQRQVRPCHLSNDDDHGRVNGGAVSQSSQRGVSFDHEAQDIPREAKQSGLRRSVEREQEISDVRASADDKNKVPTIIFPAAGSPGRSSATSPRVAPFRSSLPPPVRMSPLPLRGLSPRKLLSDESGTEGVGGLESPRRHLFRYSDNDSSDGGSVPLVSDQRLPQVAWTDYESDASMVSPRARRSSLSGPGNVGKHIPPTERFYGKQALMRLLLDPLEGLEAEEAGDYVLFHYASDVDQSPHRSVQPSLSESPPSVLSPSGDSIEMRKRSNTTPNLMKAPFYSSGESGSSSPLRTSTTSTAVVTATTMPASVVEASDDEPSPSSPTGNNEGSSNALLNLRSSLHSEATIAATAGSTPRRLAMSEDVIAEQPIEVGEPVKRSRSADALSTAASSSIIQIDAGGVALTKPRSASEALLSFRSDHPLPRAGSPLQLREFATSSLSASNSSSASMRPELLSPKRDECEGDDAPGEDTVEDAPSPVCRADSSPSPPPDDTTMASPLSEEPPVEDVIAAKVEFYEALDNARDLQRADASVRGSLRTKRMAEQHRSMQTLFHPPMSAGLGSSVSASAASSAAAPVDGENGADVEEEAVTFLQHHMNPMGRDLELIPLPRVIKLRQHYEETVLSGAE
eukprot:TRINITY_DN2519_c0_g1_i1.p1 TRINITY_DN2519_c0_g1~~TRINITY_DN2519_c0_g1_i1.p1  ORF type:complete len:2816 (+),score=613.67 TRINITY_DN2519_c0_g1_i1:201-8648(+)